MGKKLFVKPQKGRKVPDLLGGYLPEGGAEVIFNAYWQRRLRDKDVLLAEGKEVVRKPAAPAESGADGTESTKKTATGKKAGKATSKKKDGEVA